MYCDYGLDRPCRNSHLTTGYFRYIPRLGKILCNEIVFFLSNKMHLKLVLQKLQTGGIKCTWQSFYKQAITEKDFMKLKGRVRFQYQMKRKVIIHILL